MLILARGWNDKVIVNEELIIVVTYISRGQIKLGFQGDVEKYKIDRYEIYEDKKANPK